jgi:hypothetical protein
VAVEPAHVERVWVVSKCHLDVGFTDLAAAVRDRWLTEFLPRALATAAELRGRGGPHRLCWTTGSWILHEALEAADADERARLEAAIAAGDLAWHALPFTTHTEIVDRSLIEHGLSLSAELDDRFGRRTRAAKLTDVPGHTRGLVPLLAAAGVDFLHVGVNPAAAAPAVPERFLWRDPAAEAPPGSPPAEVVVMYQHGAYGATQVLDGTADAAAVEMTSDNAGPPGADDVAATWERLARAFPGAHIRAASLDDVADLLRPVRAELPVVTDEIGDTWVHGTAADPVKLAGIRELGRRRRRWLADGRVEPRHPVLRRASTRLLLAAEHTWGLDQKSWWRDTGSWSERELAAARRRADTRRFEASWVEQRRYLDEFVDVLRQGGLTAEADDAVAGLGAVCPAPPSVDGLVARHQLLGLSSAPSSSTWTATTGRSSACAGGTARPWPTRSTRSGGSATAPTTRRTTSGGSPPTTAEPVPRTSGGPAGTTPNRAWRRPMPVPPGTRRAWSGPGPAGGRPRAATSRCWCSSCTSPTSPAGPAPHPRGSWWSTRSGRRNPAGCAAASTGSASPRHAGPSRAGGASGRWSTVRASGP